jgi:WD40 repeat protein
VQDWEAGLNVPTANRLQALIAVLLEGGGLSAGREGIEARMLWAAALNESGSRLRMPLDEDWLAAVLATSAPEARRAGQAGRTAEVASVARRHDWGEAPDDVGFIGRVAELQTCRTWVIQENCRLLVLLGMGGIGKTTLAARLAQDVSPHFRCIYWRSLRDALPLGEWLAGAIGLLSDHELIPPTSESERLIALLELLRTRRSLLVLDNFETLLEPGRQEGGYRSDSAGYGRLLEAVGDGRHQSCLVLTSREAPRELTRLGGGSVRRLELGGLQATEGQALLAHIELAGDPDEWAGLIGHFGGNGLALKVVGERIRQLFGGDIGAFLREESGSGSVFGDVRRLLEQQIERGSALEQDVLRVLAVEREPVSLTQLSALGPFAIRGAILDAVEGLRRRSLVERVETNGTSAFTLQPVVLEHVTHSLVEELTDEIARGAPQQLIKQPVIRAQAKEYVRQSQERLIGVPILQLTKARSGESGTRRRLLALLEGWRGRPPDEQGFGPGNVVNLLRLLHDGELRELDFSNLSLRQPYLAGVEAQDTSLEGAHVVDAVLAEAFPPPFRVALSGDGGLMAVGTSSGEIWVFRVADRTSVLAIKGHTSSVWGVALSADGRLLASGGDDRMVRLWDVPTGRALFATEDHTNAVRGVALSAGGELLASGGADGTVRLWEATSGRPLRTLDTHTSGVTSVALSADGRLLAGACDDGTVRVWEAQSGRSLGTLHGHTSAVWGVALSAGGEVLATGCVDGSVRLWDVSSGHTLTTLQGHTSAVWSVALAADGRVLASGSAEGTVRLWEAPSGRPLAILQGHTSMVMSVASSADGRLVASSSADGSVRLWDVPSGRMLATLQGHTRAVFGVALAADGRHLASGHADGTVRLWDLAGGRLVATLRGHSSAIRVAFSVDGRLLATGGADCSVKLWDVESGHELATLLGHASAVTDVAFSRDQPLLASASADRTVRLWDVPSGRALARLEGHTNAVRSVSLSEDGRLLASGSADGTVRLWDVRSGRELATLEGHTGGVWSVTFIADPRSASSTERGERMLASGSVDGTVRLWEVPSGRPLATLQGHTSTVLRVSVSADGRRLASGSGDGTIRLWELPSGRSLVVLQGHTSTVFAVALSADGRLLASGSGDGTVKLWETEGGACTGSLQNELCYERMDITGMSGVTAAQRAALLALGAVDKRAPVRETGAA